MKIRRIGGVVIGFAAGLVVGVVFCSGQLFAQFDSGGSKNFNEAVMDSRVPASYGKLVAISDVNFYFQAENGTVYVLRQKTQSTLDPNVTVIKRGE
jgi:hypothetical protein